MSTNKENLPRISFEEMLPATSHVQHQEIKPYSRPVKLTRYVIDLATASDAPHQNGDSEVHAYPLRLGQFGGLYPHIYANDIETEGEQGELCTLHTYILQRYSINGSVDDDDATKKFESLLHNFDANGDASLAPLASKSKELFEHYMEIRAEKRDRIAEKLSKVASERTLYLVGVNQAEKSTSPARAHYAVRIIGIQNEVTERSMHWAPVIEHPTNGEAAMLPEHFTAPQGVSAPRSSM